MTSPVVIGDAMLFLADARDWLKSVPGCLKLSALITDPPYGVKFDGKATKHTTQKTGGYEGGDDAVAGPEFVASMLERVERAAVFPGNRLLHSYPTPKDIGCVYCPSGAGIGPWGFVCFHPVLFYGPRVTNVLRPTSMQSFAVSEVTGHPCPKPVEWMRWLVDLATLPDETVIDPFMGSGTTGVACLSLGRKFIGIEICEAYFQIACRRIDDAYRQGRLFDEPRPKSKQEALL